METISDIDLRDLLDTEAASINNPAFIDEDPVQFPRRFDDIRDIEITSLLVSAIAWGKRSMILRDADRMLAMMDNSPYRFVVEQGYRDIPDNLNIHRTFFTENLKHFLTGLHVLYKKFDTLDSILQSCMSGVNATDSLTAASMADKLSGILEGAAETEDTSSLSYRTAQELYEYFSNQASVRANSLLGSSGTAESVASSLLGKSSTGTANSSQSASSNNSSSANGIDLAGMNQQIMRGQEIDFSKIDAAVENAFAESTLI